jgi:hypothetical protein
MKTSHYACFKALDELNELGFTWFSSQEDISKNKYEIVHIYRYEGDSNPDDEAVVFGIKSKSGKRVFVTGLLQTQFLKQLKC